MRKRTVLKSTLALVLSHFCLTTISYCPAANPRRFFPHFSTCVGGWPAGQVPRISLARETGKISAKSVFVYMHIMARNECLLIKLMARVIFLLLVLWSERQSVCWTYSFYTRYLLNNTNIWHTTSNNLTSIIIAKFWKTQTFIVFFFTTSMFWRLQF